MGDIVAALERIAQRLDAVERRLEALFVGRLDKEWYTTDEVAVLTDRAPWTVREWCRHGRVRARKQPGDDHWVVSKEEVERVLSEGLLPATE